MRLLPAALDPLLAKAKELIDGSHLKARIARGGTWLAVGSGVEEMLRLARNMILTRLIVPEAFGIVATVLAVNALMEAFTQIGLREAIVQHPEARSRTYLNGAWWLAVTRGLLLYAAGFFLAPLVAAFYEKPQIVDMLRLVFLTLIFNSAISPRAYIMVKEMRFKLVVAIYQLGAAIGVVAAILLAVFAFANAYTLILGFLAESLAVCVLSHIVCPFRPGFEFTREHARALFTYVRGIFGLPILTFIFLRADIFVLGKVVPDALLGFYSMAVHLAQMADVFIAKLLNPVLLAAFAEIQSDNGRINRLILRFTSLLALAGVPAMAFAALYGGTLLGLLYGPGYDSVAAAFAIAFVAYMLKGIATPANNFFFGTGRPRDFRFYVAVRAAVVAAIMYPFAARWHDVGAAAAVATALVIAFALQIKRMHRLTGLRARAYLSVFRVPLCASSVVAAVWALSRMWSLPPLIDLAIGGMGCAAAIAAGALVLARRRFGPSPPPREEQGS
ncbi:MAG TPA: hypothetical protein DCM87_19160 [Planctomycetes bacterium]|nr:hypothetical protein [Planctomycetota bacterium]